MKKQKQPFLGQRVYPLPVFGRGRRDLPLVMPVSSAQYQSAQAKPESNPRPTRRLYA